MVFFTCNGCGSSLKKNQVEKYAHISILLFNFNKHYDNIFSFMQTSEFSMSQITAPVMRRLPKRLLVCFYKYFLCHYKKKQATIFQFCFHSGEEYKAHTKCITEEEKYSAKGWVAKPGQNKNERKQAEWVAMIQDLVNTVGNTDSALTNVLQKISQHENIPRKKPKFMVKTETVKVKLI